jgi:N-acetylmuramic acid 6-phosphate etherase
VGLDELITEAQSAETHSLDLLATSELVELMNREDALVPSVVAAAADDVAAVIDRIVERLEAGGRLVYVGAGTSGRLAAADAAECEATFSTRPGQVVALLAGEEEAAEDDHAAGTRDVQSIRVGGADALVAVSASGRTPYVLGAVEAASAAGAFTACIVSASDSALARLVDHEIAVVVGPEVIAGSTRLKAGTAQKLVLNAISTISMIRLGKVFDDLMVDVAATNEKLRARVRRIVGTATSAAPAAVDEALAAAGGSAKVAIVSLLAGIDAESARTSLDDVGGSVRAALRRVQGA